MFNYKEALLLYVFVLCHLLVYGQKEKKFFRNDYTYTASTESFYKIHTLHKNWREAKMTCASEGASLFYPADSHEAETVIALIAKSTPFQWVFLGASDILSKGIFNTNDGVPINDAYHNWATGEPNGLHKENCCILNRDGFIHDKSCASTWPFVCKKSLNSLQWNKQCNMPIMDYKYNESLGKCYKFHLNPLNWMDAFAACSDEQSYLAVINSPKEAEYLKNITAEAPKDNVQGDYLRGAVHLGFHNRFGDGWQTAKGTTLEDSGYAKWSYGQPDGNGAEKCGSMFYDGELNDIGCHWRMFFICEHDIDNFDDNLDVRFGDSTENTIGYE